MIYERAWLSYTGLYLLAALPRTSEALDSYEGREDPAVTHVSTEYLNTLTFLHLATFHS